VRWCHAIACLVVMCAKDTGGGAAFNSVGNTPVARVVAVDQAPCLLLIVLWQLQAAPVAGKPHQAVLSQILRTALLV
jgi:hypothetical protein